MLRSVPSLLLLALMLSSARAAEWTQFRGPGGLGRSDADAAPLKWSAGRNVQWRTELPGPGTSSPVVVGDRIYLTSYSGYGLDPANPGEMQDLRRHLVCIDRSTGKIRWTREFQPQLPESEYAGGNDAKHGYSSSTPTSDGQRLYLFFGKSGVLCVDLDGKTLWQTSVGSGTRGWGSSNSPVLYKNLVIINASVESGQLVALDKTTGRKVWSADGMRASWNTPLVVSLPTGDELAVSVQGHVLGFEPSTGEELWRCEGIPTYVCPSLIAHEDVIYATGGRGTQYTLAIRAGGRGDVTSSHLLWRVPKGSNVSSPVYHDGHVYVMNDSKGIAYCFDASDGRVEYEERLSPRPGLVYSSSLYASGHIYYVSQHDGTFVLAAEPEFQLLAHNELDDARANASPVIDDGQLLLRNDRYLYCIGQQQN